MSDLDVAAEKGRPVQDAGSGVEYQLHDVASWKTWRADGEVYAGSATEIFLTDFEGRPAQDAGSGSSNCCVIS